MGYPRPNQNLNEHCIPTVHTAFRLGCSPFMWSITLDATSLVVTVSICERPTAYRALSWTKSSKPEKEEPGESGGWRGLRDRHDVKPL